MAAKSAGRFKRLARACAVTAAMLIAVSTVQIVAVGSPAEAAVAWPATLLPGQRIVSGAAMVAPGGRVAMVMQGDGNLVEHRDGKVIWATYTQGNPGAWAIMQTDGNFVVYTPKGKALWNTHTAGYGGAHAALQADSYFVVYSAVKTPLWWRDIGRGAALCNSTAADPAGTAITRWNPVTLCVLQVLRQSGGNLSDVNLMIEYESSGDPNAINLYDINAKEGHPSKGLIQVIQPTFDRFRSLQLSTDLFNPAANLYAGLNYAIYTYGSIHNVPGLVSLRNGGIYQGYIVLG